MFGSNQKKENSKTMSSNTPSQGSNSINALGVGTKVEGTLHANNDIRIDGELIGNLHCKGKLILGPQGHINGEIHCQNAVIEGSFSGKLSVAELLNVKDSARIEGEINTKQLNVQSGAVFNVSCAMGAQVTKLKSSEIDQPLSLSSQG